MRKYEENFGELLEKKCLKETEPIKREMIVLRQKMTEMEFFLKINFQEPEKNEIIDEMLKSRQFLHKFLHLNKSYYFTRINVKDKNVLVNLNSLKTLKAKAIFSGKIIYLL